MEKQQNAPKINHINVVIDCNDTKNLSEFYSKLLSWEITHPAQNGWAAITAPQGQVFAFQEIEEYTPPVWPYEKGKQGQMLHLDFWVDDLQAGVRHAIACGATAAPNQYFKTSTTMFDPEGHPFCIDTDGEE